MRHFLWMLALGIVFLFSTQANNCLAQDRADTGRHKTPPKEEPDNSRKTAEVDPRASRWEIQVNGGLLGGGDLFRASNSTGEPVAWVPEDQGDWLTHRIRVRMESSFILGMQVQRKMGELISLRGGFSYAEAEIVAEAPIEEVAEVYPYDNVDIYIFSLGAEIRLTKETLSYPYVGADLLVLGFSPQKSSFLSQTNFGGRLTLGYHHQFDPAWSFCFEAGVSRTAFSSGTFPIPEDIEPQNLVYESENHLQIFEAKFAIGVKI